MDIKELHSEIFQNLLARRAHLPHALLFSGQAGIGKFAFAKAFAKALLCESPLASGDACGACLACGWYQEGNHPDFRMLIPEALQAEVPKEKTKSEEKAEKKASQEIKIEEVRALEDFLHIGTHRQGFRVIVVYPAEAMNRNTANALLKSLEEPERGTLFCLVSDQAERLLPTIRSRCQMVAMPVPSPEKSAQLLKEAKVKNPEEWLLLAGGAPFSAIALSENHALLDAVLPVFLSGQKVNVLQAASQIEKVIKAEKRENLMKQVIGFWQKWGFDLALATQYERPRYFVKYANELISMASATTPQKVSDFAKKLNAATRLSGHPLNSRLFLEAILIEYRGVF